MINYLKITTYKCVIGTPWILIWVIVLVSAISLSMDRTLPQSLTATAFQKTATQKLKAFIDNWSGKSPVEVLETVEKYLDQGADPNITVRDNRPFLIVLINDIHSLWTKSVYPKIILHESKFENHDDFLDYHASVVNKLLIHGADPNAYYLRGSRTLSALYIAVAMRSPWVAKVLLAHGADPKDPLVVSSVNYEEKPGKLRHPEIKAIIDQHTKKNTNL